ncbi:MAG: hypothetical protein JST87_05375 [Bacteroidetes bacterium]|nr:hypothetical protein [Bacteroidota bacterium]
MTNQLPEETLKRIEQEAEYIIEKAFNNSFEYLCLSENHISLNVHAGIKMGLTSEAMRSMNLKNALEEIADFSDNATGDTCTERLYIFRHNFLQLKGIAEQALSSYNQSNLKGE